MKKFTFRLERLGKIREDHEQAALVRLAAAQTDLVREERTLAKLVGSITEFNSKLSTMLARGASAGMLAASDAFRCCALSAARRQRTRVRTAAGNVAEKTKEFNAAHQKAEAIRKLHQARRAEYRKESFRSEQLEQDDRTGARAAARRWNSAP